MSSEIENPGESLDYPPESTPGPVPKRYTLEYLKDPKVIANLIYKTRHLTDEAFNDLVDDVGTRAMRLVLRAQVADGNVRAAQLYDQITTRDRIKRKELDPTEVNVSPAPFVQQPRRNPTTDEDDSSSR